jgi:hypothetical protein
MCRILSRSLLAESTGASVGLTVRHASGFLGLLMFL